MLLDLRIAIASLATHKFRTVMAMLGIFLGALAFTGVQGMSQSMVRRAEMEAEKMGPNLFAVMAGQVRFHRGGGISFRGESTSLKLSDAQALENGLPAIVTMAPMQQNTRPVRHGNVTVNGLVTATWTSYQRVRSFYVEHGRFFSGDEQANRAKVVVLGTKIADRLFGSAEGALGQMVFIFRAGFRVVGVMESKGRDLAGVDQDEQVFMPLSTYLRRASNTDHLKGVLMEIAPGADMVDLRRGVTDILRSRHCLGPGEKDDFSLLEARETIQLKKQALDLMRTLGIIVSTISFAVGGMGILSIMVLMVRTRRREIGIRRAVGGTRGNIVRQFMLESAFMSMAGGTLGVAVCVVLLLVVSGVSDFPLVLDTTVLALALGGSAGLGLAAGAYPAWQASKVSILDVLTG